MRRKDSVALFEVISKGKVKRPADEGEADADIASQTPPLPQSQDLAPDGGSADDVQQTPQFAGLDRRISLSLNYASCIAAAMGLVVLLGTMFWLGRITAGRIDSSAPVATSETGADAPAGQGDSSRSSRQATRISGKYYLIVDRMLPGLTQDSKLDAEAIIEWLKTKGHEATLAIMGTRYVVLSSRPFDSMKSEQAKNFALTIDALGRSYRPQPPRSKYTFSQYRVDASGRREFSPSWHRWE